MTNLTRPHIFLGLDNSHHNGCSLPDSLTAVHDSGMLQLLLFVIYCVLHCAAGTRFTM